MTIGVSIFIAAVGAVLRYAVGDNVDDVDLRMVGLILMIAGAVGLLLGLFLQVNRRRIVDDEVVVARRRPIDERPVL